MLRARCGLEFFKRSNSLAPKRCINPVKGGNYNIRLGAEIGFSQRGVASLETVPK